MGDGFTARRDHGPHNGGDIHAAPGTPIVAPRNMSFKYGKQGGRNLKDNDYWAHFDELDANNQPTGRELRFAHMSGVPKLKAGDIVQQGEPWSTVGNIVNHPHVHMSVYDNNKGRSVDWPSALGLTPGQSQTQTQLASNPQLEKRMNSTASTIPTPINEGESIPFDKGGKSYMDPTMLARGGFGLPAIPGTDTSDLSAGINAGANTQTSFLGQILSALGGGGGGGGGGGRSGGLSSGGGLDAIGGALGGPVGAAIGGLAQMGLEIPMLLKSDKMAREHAGWLQDIAVNPPRPGWARAMSGPGLNK